PALESRLSSPTAAGTPCCRRLLEAVSREHCSSPGRVHACAARPALIGSPCAARAARSPWMMARARHWWSRTAACCRWEWWPWKGLSPAGTSSPFAHEAARTSGAGSRISPARNWNQSAERRERNWPTCSVRGRPATKSSIATTFTCGNRSEDSHGLRQDAIFQAGPVDRIDDRAQQGDLEKPRDDAGFAKARDFAGLLLVVDVHGWLILRTRDTSKDGGQGRRPSRKSLAGLAGLGFTISGHAVAPPHRPEEK